MQKLAATAIKQAKPKATPYKMTDGGGLYLLVNSKGKYWRYNYRFTGKQKTLAIGVYPDISLSAARKLHQSAREKLAEGIDPSEAKKAQKITKNLATADEFEPIAREWFSQKMLNTSETHKSRTIGILEKDLFPNIGAKPISKITAPEVLAVLKKIESRGVDALRAKQVAGQIFRYAVATGRIESDPSRDLAGVLKTAVVKHHAAITEPDKLGKLLVAIDGYEGTRLGPSYGEL